MFISSISIGGNDFFVLSGFGKKIHTSAVLSFTIQNSINIDFIGFLSVYIAIYKYAGNHMS